MKSRSEIWLCALKELGSQCSVSTQRDAETLASRISKEGDSFLMVALPTFAKDLERSLSIGRIPKDAFVGFGRQRFTIWSKPDGEHADWFETSAASGAPKFLGGFLDLLFMRELHLNAHQTSMNAGLSGSWVWEPRLRLDVDPELQADAIAAIRQLCLMFGKEKERCSDSVVKAAFAAFRETDKELDAPFLDGRADVLFEGGLLDHVKKTVSIVFGGPLSEIDKMIYDGDLIPKHGPGKTADYRIGNQKWMQTVWHDRLEYLFPYLEMVLPNARHHYLLNQVEFRAPSEELPVRLVDVPKTHTTPRLIAIEPTCMQYVQQAISIPLRDLLERDSRSKHFIGFAEQWPNQAMAQIGSEDGSFATLDLSEASDRVANWHVEELFADFPHFLEGIQACRSTTAKLPSGEVIPLLKFASMGSAMTFPIEALVFSAIALSACVKADSLPQTMSSYRKYIDRVRVYGDDIIVPTDKAEIVIETLETFGYRVNRNKSFWTGEFRESCGKEYWKGMDVSIVRFRKRLPTSRRDVDELVSTVATRNLLFQAGLVHTAALLDDVLEPILKWFPYVAETSPILGRIHPLGYYQVDGLHGDYQSPVTRGWVVKPKIPVNQVFDVYALQR